MKPDLSQFQERLAEIRGRISTSVRRSGRSPDDVTLIAVTKTIPAEVVAGAVAEGISDLGENRVQEAESKVPSVGRVGVNWHLIGHLQSNKAAKAVALFDRIHGLDSLALAESVAKRAVAAGRTIPVLIEVNVSGEATKFGVAPGAVAALAEQVAGLAGLVLDGLMTVGAPVDVAEDARAGFAKLREIRDEASRRVGRPLRELSMGMSGDFEVAIEEGSTMVRIGSALFGVCR